MIVAFFRHWSARPRASSSLVTAALRRERDRAVDATIMIPSTRRARSDLNPPNASVAWGRSYFRSWSAGASLLALLVACSGGQSGNEGDISAMPCGGGGLVLAAQVSALDQSCVTIEVTQIASAAPVFDDQGRALLDVGDVAVGEHLRGRRGSVYAYLHEFSVGEPVAALVGSWEEQLNFELMPMNGELVQIQWVGKEYETSLAELALPECDVRRWAPRRELPSQTSDGSDIAAAPPPPRPMCTP